MAGFPAVTPELPMDRYAVIGNPIAHSLSPKIHARFAAQLSDPVEYSALLAPLDGFAGVARAFLDGGGRGVNVTLPFKVEAFELADAASERARAAGAANFLARRDGRIEADNTDGAGLVADLVVNLGASLHGARILLVGAGGAARGAVMPILAEKPARLVIANRAAARSRELAARFAARGPVEACALDAIPGQGFDIVLNATSASTKGEPLVLPEAAWRGAPLAYDMAYGPAAEPFLSAARLRGARASDGLGMLVEQAAESWFLWRGRRPATGEVLAALRAGAA